ncbi:MAG: hypothetical protein HOP31_04965 [Ignavibacteria bacterium]|nr:hypothetical protein [Ignavibacteria bacterium]
MKTNIKKVTGSDKIPAKTEKVSEEQTNDHKSAMEQLIKDKAGDDQNVSKQMSNMGLAVNKNTKKTEKLTSKHTFAHSKVDRSRYITKK